jgi:hypothetical protein
VKLLGVRDRKDGCKEDSDHHRHLLRPGKDQRSKNRQAGFLFKLVLRPAMRCRLVNARNVACIYCLKLHTIWLTSSCGSDKWNYRQRQSYSRSEDISSRKEQDNRSLSFIESVLNSASLIQESWIMFDRQPLAVTIEPLLLPVRQVSPLL